MLHSQLGRFVSRDPIGYHGDDPNLSRYVANLVTGATDPSGLDDGLEVGDYYDLRITRQEVFDWGEDAAQQRAMARIAARGRALAAHEVAWGTGKEFVGGTLVVLGGIGVANAWNPFGWGALVVSGVGMMAWGGYDLYIAYKIGKAADKAIKEFADPCKLK